MLLFFSILSKSLKDKKITTVSNTSLVTCIQLSRADVYCGFKFLEDTLFSRYAVGVFKILHL